MYIIYIYFNPQEIRVSQPLFSEAQALNCSEKNLMCQY